MDERIEELYKAVLGGEGKPLGEMRQAVRRHIVEAEKIVKETTEPDLDDLNNERAVQRFRHALVLGVVARPRAPVEMLVRVAVARARLETSARPSPPLHAARRSAT